MGSRPLTEGEIRICRTIFGDTINYDEVRIHSDKFFPLQPDNTIIAPFGEIYYPPGISAYSDDFSKEPIEKIAGFMHEMTHVKQYQENWNPLHVVWARLTEGGDYDYRNAIAVGTPYDALTVEQQGDLVMSVFYQENGIPGHTDTPENLAQYLPEDMQKNFEMAKAQNPQDPFGIFENQGPGNGNTLLASSFGAAAQGHDHGGHNHEHDNNMPEFSFGKIV